MKGLPRKRFTKIYCSVKRIGGEMLHTLGVSKSASWALWGSSTRLQGSRALWGTSTIPGLSLPDASGIPTCHSNQTCLQAWTNVPWDSLTAVKCGLNFLKRKAPRSLLDDIDQGSGGRRAGLVTRGQCVACGFLGFQEYLLRIPSPMCARTRG